MSAPTPLLDFFKRGEVARDVRLLAAQGALAPRAHEQLSILVLLLEDADPEIRRVADTTLGRIPVEALQAFLGRPDVPIGLREYFGDHGIFPSEIPTITIDEDDALIETEPEASDEEEAPADPQTMHERLARMGFTERLRAAMKGTREIRAILIRDSNKMIAAAVLSSPKVTGHEIENFARMANVSEDVLRVIASNRAWTKQYGVILGLVKNPKTPVALSLNLMARLNARDVAGVSTDRNVPEALRIAARKKVVANVSGR